MSKFKVGDKVRVTGDTREWDHAADVGSEWRILYVIDGDGAGYPSPVGYCVDRPDTFQTWDVAEEDLELVEPENVVSHPNHYSAGMPEGVEVIDIIRAQNGSWELSNAIKYVLRAQYKGKYVEDLKKAMQYLTWEIEKNDAS